MTLAQIEARRAADQQKDMAEYAPHAPPEPPAPDIYAGLSATQGRVLRVLRNAALADEALPTMEAVARAIDRDKSTIKHATRALQDLGLIEIEDGWKSVRVVELDKTIRN